MKLRYDLFWKMLLFLIFSLCYISCQAEDITLGDKPTKDIVVPKDMAWNVRINTDKATLIMKDKGDIIFKIADKEMLRITEGGKFYAKGRRITRNIKIYHAFKKWMNKAIGVRREE